MKRCPQCNRVETDEALAFCRTDGSRLVADTEVSEPATAILPAHSTDSGFTTGHLQSVPSIAVLPFVNMSADVENEYFCDGLAEEMLNALAKIDALRVAARTSAFSFKGKDIDVRDIGRKLNVATVLEGSVRKSGNRLRITAQLINVADGYQVWSERFDRELADIFEVQDEITLAVVDVLKVKLFGGDRAAVLKRHTENAEAYKLYLQGIFYLSKLNSPKAIECFQQAVGIDPNYALAYAGLGDSYMSRIVTTGAQPVADAKEALSKAREFAAKALELDDDLADAHALMGLLLLVQDHDFASFEREINRAIALNPNYAEGRRRNGIRLFYLGQFEASRNELEKALELDPLSNLIAHSYAQTLVYEGRYDEAEAQIQKNLEMDSGFALFHRQLSVLYRLKGDYAGAAEESAKTSELQNHPESARLKRDSFAKGGWRAYLRALVTELEQNKSNPYALAIAYVELGERDKAFAALDEVYDAHSNFVGYLKIDPQLNPLRDDPRFGALLNKAGFPEIDTLIQ